MDNKDTCHTLRIDMNTEIHIQVTNGNYIEEGYIYDAYDNIIVDIDESYHAFHDYNNETGVLRLSVTDYISFLERFENVTAIHGFICHTVP